MFPAFNSPFSQGTGSRTILGLVFAWPYDNISEDKESWGQYLGLVPFHCSHLTALQSHRVRDTGENIAVCSCWHILCGRDSHHPSPLCISYLSVPTGSTFWNSLFTTARAAPSWMLNVCLQSTASPLSRKHRQLNKNLNILVFLFLFKLLHLLQPKHGCGAIRN